MNRHVKAAGCATAVAVIAAVGVRFALDDLHDGSTPPPPGWVQTSCFPGETGKCYAPPPGETFTIDTGYGTEQCTTVEGGRHICEYVTTAAVR